MYAKGVTTGDIEAHIQDIYGIYVPDSNPEHAPQKSQTWHGGAVAPVAPTGLHPPPGKPVPGHEKAGPVPTGREETSL